MTLLPTGRALLAGAALVAAMSGSAGAAHAEPVRLRAGTTLEATSIQVQGDALLLHLEVGAGKGTMRLPMAQVAPADLVRLLAARTDPGDAPGQLRIARAALEAGLFAEAVGRAAAAAALDPALAVEQARVEHAVRTALADDALAEIELDLRLGRPGAARVRAAQLLEHGVPVVPPDLEAARARLLLALAEDALAKAAKAAAAKPVPLAPPAPGPAPAAAVAAVADAAALTSRALDARERAADPSLAPARREAFLSDAAIHLLHARRILLALGAGAAPDLLSRLEALRGLLVATWLDMADLARGACQPGIALDRVQAALVLEPESERAWELRRWLEADLNPPYLLQPGPPVVVEHGFASPFATPFSFGALGRVFPPAYGGAFGHGPYASGYRFGGGYRDGGGTVRYAGTRR
jgi:tetratricopeptide (TPR) repeat protein